MDIRADRSYTRGLVITLAAGLAAAVLAGPAEAATLRACQTRDFLADDIAREIQNAVGDLLQTRHRIAEMRAQPPRRGAFQVALEARIVELEQRATDEIGLLDCWFSQAERAQMPMVCVVVNDFADRFDPEIVRRLLEDGQAAADGPEAGDAGGGQTQEAPDATDTPMADELADLNVAVSRWMMHELGSFFPTWQPGAPSDLVNHVATGGAYVRIAANEDPIGGCLLRGGRP